MNFDLNVLVRQCLYSPIWCMGMVLSSTAVWEFFFHVVCMSVTPCSWLYNKCVPAIKFHSTDISFLLKTSLLREANLGDSHIVPIYFLFFAKLWFQGGMGIQVMWRQYTYVTGYKSGGDEIQKNFRVGTKWCNLK